MLLYLLWQLRIFYFTAAKNIDISLPHSIKMANAIELEFFANKPITITA